KICRPSECKRKWIPKTQCPNFMAGRGRLYKWIVRRNCAVRGYAKNFSKKITQILSVTSLGIVSHGNIKVAISSKVKGASIMVGGWGEGVQLKEDYPTAC